jgi:hypothetical protein
MIIEPTWKNFALAKRDKEVGLEDPSPGSDITGGSVIMNGLSSSPSVLEMPVRMGIPTDVGGLPI